MHDPLDDDRHTTAVPQAVAEQVPRDGARAALVRYGGIVAIWAAVPLVLVGLSTPLGLIDRLPEAAGAVFLPVVMPIVVLFVLGMATRLVSRPIPGAPMPVRAPVHGRWKAMNSPATKVPSHGTHGYGQTYAIDLVGEPEPGARPSFGGRQAMRHPRDYPAFGAPVIAPVTGLVVRARDGARDHRCRSNLLGFAYMMIEGLVLSLRGASGPMGNHVVIEVENDHRFVALAHLQHGTVEVAVGDRVEAGDRLGRVGNSGNSSEPHIHLHVMDRADPNRAIGEPFTFIDVVVTDAVELPSDADVHPTVPANDETFHAGVDYPLRMS